MQGKLGISAVERNKIRRRFYEAIRLNFNVSASRPRQANQVLQRPQTCYDVAVLLSRRAQQADFASIKQEILNSIKKLPS